MVYCGKPSKGCQTCRERKIRCDQVPEGCGQCKKQNVVCPGYRDQLDLIFRNESHNVVRKAKARESRAKTKASVSPSKSTTPPDHATPSVAAARGKVICASHHASFEALRKPDYTAPVRSDKYPTVSGIQFPARYDDVPLSTAITLSPTLEERATSFFITNYVIGAQGPAKGHLDAINSLYTFDDNLSASIRAVGLAGFANVEGSSDVMKKAITEYARALHLTNQALRSPDAARRDSTLLSVMILSIYETVTGNTQKSLKAWSEHISGAAALVRLRGYDQLRTIDGRRMVVQVTSNLLIACIQRELPMPDYILQLRKTISYFVDTTEPAWQMQEHMMQFCAFRASIRDPSGLDPRWILERALELDDGLRRLFENPPLSWRYETRYTTPDEDPEHVWNNCYHIYYDYWVAQIWNAMRTCRIMLHEAIRHAIQLGFQQQASSPSSSASASTPLPSNPSTDPFHSNCSTHIFGPSELTQFHLSASILSTLQSDILASVPQHIGFAPRRHSRPGKPAKSTPLKFPSSNMSPLFNAMAHVKSSCSHNANPKLDSYAGANANVPSTTYSHPLPADVQDPSSHAAYEPPPPFFSTYSSTTSLPILRALGGYFLMWPLFLAAVVDIASESSRSWVIGRLRHISQKMGIKQAAVLARVIEEKAPVRNWLLDRGAGEVGEGSVDAVWKGRITLDGLIGPGGTTEATRAGNEVAFKVVERRANWGKETWGVDLKVIERRMEILRTNNGIEATMAPTYQKMRPYVNQPHIEMDMGLEAGGFEVANEM